jgi:hypothetical protein
MSFWINLFATLEGQLNAIHARPASLMKLVVLWSWKSSNIPSSLYVSSFDSYNFTRPPPIKPSSVSHVASSTDIESANQLLWGLNSNGTGNMDPTCLDNQLLLSWHNKVTTYSTDFNVFVSVPQSAPPQPEYANITYFPQTDQNEQHRLLVIFGSSSSMERYAKLRDLYLNGSWKEFESTNDNTLSWSPEKEVLVSIFIVFLVVKEDTHNFIRRCCSELKAVVST